MALPLIFPPAGTPQFIVEGHSRTPVSAFEDTPALVGHGRKRRVWSVAPRTQTVCWILTNAQMVAVDAWFENTLRAGDEQFTAQVAAVGEPQTVEYWTAAWVEPYTAEPIALGIWRVTGELLLTGTPETSRPATGALALEVAIDLTGSAVVYGPSALELEIEIALGASTGLYLEITIALDSPGFELRDDDSYELRDDDTLELRD